MKKWEKPFKFLISGGTAAAVEYVSFLLLHGLFADLNLILIQSISFMVGLLTSFTLNKKWVFKVSGESKKMLGKYLVLALINLTISNLIITLLNEVVVLYIAKFITMAIIAVWNYFIFKKLIFR